LKFYFFRQQDRNDSGPTCLRMIMKHYGRNISITKLRNICQLNLTGVSFLGMCEAAEKLNFRTSGKFIGINQLKEANLPCILHWTRYGFVVLYKIKKGTFFIADPTKGLVTYTAAELETNWFQNEELRAGMSILLSPTPVFYDNKESDYKLKWDNILKYFFTYKVLIGQLLMGMLIATILSLITPFLTQSLVDIGINTHNINFVYLILIAQVMLFLGASAVTFIRSWILLHITTRINITLLTDFLAKLMKLPISFFETKPIGDIMQRMQDQGTVQSFLTDSTLNTAFSVFNLLIFTTVLLYYSPLIFVISFSGTILYTAWIYSFLKYRRRLNSRLFNVYSINQTAVVELISGMREIKLNNCEHQKRWRWEEIQARKFKISIKSLALSQYQQAGSMFINQAKNIAIIFLSVKSVIEGQLTLGGMMAIQYIVGQANGPIENMLNFIQLYQDAKISLERLNEIYELNNEQDNETQYVNEIPIDKSITIKNITFRYPGAGNEAILHDINLSIPEGKVTAIVGMSGSGKTTILKLLLRFYTLEKGEIKVGPLSLDHLDYKAWRSQCGIVMQDGFIFSDTIVGNIVVGDENIDQQKLQRALKISNIEEFIKELPLGLNTMIGAAGNGISQGQKQRIFIARAIYKDPAFIFFDEATNSLDANNERIIMANLHEFFKGKTVVIVAHTLSTVVNADNIVVMEKGRIIEQGSHTELSNIKGKYYSLLKNQLELGT